MTSKDDKPIISDKDVIRGGVLFGMIWVLPFGVLFAAMENPLWEGGSPELWFSHAGIYSAISFLGLVLAWSSPNSMILWAKPVQARVIIPLSCLWMGTVRALTNLCDKDYGGALAAIIVSAVGLGLWALVVSIRKHVRKRSRT
jgi:O-antigen/teichoic acid export membrane protein